VEFFGSILIWSILGFRFGFVRKEVHGMMDWIFLVWFVLLLTVPHTISVTVWPLFQDFFANIGFNRLAAAVISMGITIHRGRRTNFISVILRPGHLGKFCWEEVASTGSRAGAPRTYAPRAIDRYKPANSRLLTFLLGAFG
jgi:hypothetical protein